MKLQVRFLTFADGGATSTGIVLTDENGKIVGRQIGANLESGVNDVPVLTVRFYVDGKDLSLSHEPVNLPKRLDGGEA